MNKPTGLVPYRDDFRGALLPMIADFFDFHRGLLDKAPEEDLLDDAAQVLEEWRDQGLALVTEGDTPVGFARMAPRGGPVVWLEDLYVLPAYRGRGIATRAVTLCEAYAREVLEAPALCVEVVSRNLDAMRLYRGLGFDSISMITLRKELDGENPRQTPTPFQGMEFFT